jgi:hypothetical protein
VVQGHGHLDPRPCRVVDDVRRVGSADHRGLVDDDQVAPAEFHRAQGPAAVGEVAKEPGEVVALGDTRAGEHVAGGLGRRDPHHPPMRPCLADLGQHAGLARPRRPNNHLHAAVRGEHVGRGGGLVHPQPARRGRDLGAGLAQRGLQLGDLRAEGAGRVLAGHGWGAARAGLGHQLLLPGQLHPGRVLNPAMPLVHAAAIGPPQRCGRGGRLGRLQAGHRAKLSGQRPVSHLLKQGRLPGRAGRAPGQHPAKVGDQVRARPRGALTRAPLQPFFAPHG